MSGLLWQKKGVAVDARIMRFLAGDDVVLDREFFAYDITASWRPDVGPSDAAESRPSMFTALEEQLGLKLRPESRPVDVLLIDNIERASPD